MTVHRSLKVDDATWTAMETKARDRGFTSTSAYLRHLIQEDISGGSIEETEERLVSTISRLGAHVQSLGTMHQASFATLWTVLEVLVAAFPSRQGSPASEQRLNELRVRIAGDVRGNKLFKEIAHGQED
ncbi:MAG: hypothetical protein JWN34_3211 [Bryobacterales bacterium]|nr:hypothetical protein [Bryobacterales bacterium]